MKKLYLMILFVAITLFIISGINNSVQLITAGLARKGNLHNGQLHYKIYLFGVFPVGNATFEVVQTEQYNGQKALHLSASAKSASILSGFFSGNVRLDSYIDEQKFNPVIFKQKIFISGKPEINKEVTYNQKEHTMSILGVERTILPDTQDSLSAIFNLRRIDFDKTKNIEMSLNTNQKNYILEGTAETKDLTIGKKKYGFVLVKAEIRRRDKNPYHKSKIEMVLLRECENIPVLIKAFASGALISAKLVEIK